MHNPLSTGTVTLTNARVPAAAMGRIGDGSVETLDIEIADRDFAPARKIAADEVDRLRKCCGHGLALPG